MSDEQAPNPKRSGNSGCLLVVLVFILVGAFAAMLGDDQSRLDPSPGERDVPPTQEDEKQDAPREFVSMLADRYDENVRRRIYRELIDEELHHGGDVVIPSPRAKVYELDVVDVVDLMAEGSTKNWMTPEQHERAAAEDQARLRAWQESQRDD